MEDKTHQRPSNSILGGVYGLWDDFWLISEYRKFYEKYPTHPSRWIFDEYERKFQGIIDSYSVD